MYSNFQKSGQLLKGFLVDRNKILGKGQFGVYLATKAGKQYAAKYLHDRKVEDIRANELFLYDLGRVHENILEVESYCRSDDGYGSWIFTEYCIYGDLANFSKQFPDEFRKDETKYTIVVQTAAGLEFLHSLDKIHRDIKPGNILVTEERSRRLLVKLSDFGESRSLGQTMTATATGTPWFAAPEIFDCDEEEGKQTSKLNNKVDIFSLGLTYLAILQNRNKLLPLGEGLKQRDFVGHVLLGRPDYQAVKTEARDDDMSKRVKEVILQTVVRDPHKRLTATQMRQAIEQIQMRQQVRCPSL